MSNSMKFLVAMLFRRMVFHVTAMPDTKTALFRSNQFECLDSYHVGTMRGFGGTALFCEGKPILGENYNNWKIMAKGFIRSIIELDYAPIEYGGNLVSERKIISINIGENFYPCNVSYESEAVVNATSIGIALHEGNGKVESNIKEGWISYWEPQGDSYLGTAVLVNPDLAIHFNSDDTVHRDESLNNLWVNMKLVKNSFSYWSGFGWKERGEFDSAKDWQNHLRIEQYKKSNPISIKISKN